MCAGLERPTMEENKSYNMIPFKTDCMWKFCFRHARLNAIKVNYLAFFFSFFFNFFLMLLLENLKLYRWLAFVAHTIFFIGQY